jgi:5'-AMP-activated protein kinase regulatory gamma subunit
MLTVSDFINLIQYYYYHNTSSYNEIETIQIAQLTDKHHKLTRLDQQQYSIHPMATLYDAAVLMSETRAHRIPLVIENREIISVITQYRLLKFIANNVRYQIAGRRDKESKLNFVVITVV